MLQIEKWRNCQVCDQWKLDKKEDIIDLANGRILKVELELKVVWFPKKPLLDEEDGWFITQDRGVPPEHLKSWQLLLKL